MAWQDTRSNRLSKPKGRYDAERQSSENWRSCDVMQSEADMYKSFAEDADEWVGRYKNAEQYLEERADGFNSNNGDDRQHPSTGMPHKWFGANKAKK